MPALEPSLDDIEDIINTDDVTPQERYKNKNKVIPKIHRRKERVSGSRHKEDVVADSVIPGTQSIYVKTWGCSHNNSDGEYMAGQLAAFGYKITDDWEDADLWLLNSCTVKSPAEDHFRNEINKAQQKGKHLVLSGCVPQAQPRAGYLQGVSAVGVQQIDRVVEVVEETLKGHTVRLFGQKKSEGKKIGGARLDLPKIRKNPLIEILAINTGCLNQCTYCKTKHARGELGSYPIEDLVERARQSFQEGVCEVWLTSEDTGAYGIDIGVTIVDLLWKLVEVIPEGCMMRIGMTNPPYILQHLEEIAKILNHPRVYAFLHVPVQSASDSVLMDMKREYCQADFKRVMDVLKERLPGVTIATDVICGFPTETEEDFEETMELVRQYKFPSLFINQFFPRPGTPAAKMPQLDAQEKKKRTKQISVLFKSYHPYDHKLGERQNVLVTEVSHDKQYWVGHNKFYEQVLVPKEDGLLGKMVEVEIISTGKHYMMSKIVKEKEIFTPSVATPLAQGEISGLPKKVVVDSHPHRFWFPLSVILVGAAIIYELIRIARQLVQR